MVSIAKFVALSHCHRWKAAGGTTMIVPGYLKAMRMLAAMVCGCFLVLGWGCLLSAQEKPRISSPPIFSIAGGVYQSNLSVRLTTKSASASIRYTADGSEPSGKSAVYSGPLIINSSALIRAKAFEPGASASETISHTYTLLGPGLFDFSSNLPLVILNTLGKDVPHRTKVLVSTRFIETVNGRNTLAGAADFDGRGLINVRGNTSLRYPKHSYHLKTKDEAGNPLKVSILGFPKESDWVLYAPYPDKTLMRDVLAFDLSNKMGRYASRVRFVEVFVCEGGSKLTRGDYQGVFVLEEKIKWDKNRVNIAKLKPDDSAKPDITGGYIFKKDHLDRGEMGMAGDFTGMPMGRGMSMNRAGYPTGPGGFPASPEGFLPSYQGSSSGREGFPQNRGRSVILRDRPNSRLVFTNSGPIIIKDGVVQPPQVQFSPDGKSLVQRNQGFVTSIWEARGEGGAIFHTALRNQFFYVEPKPDEITSAQKTWLTDYLNQFESVLYGPDFKDPTNGYAAFIDAGSFIDHHIIVEATKNIDGFRFSTFYYKDRGGKVNMGPIWDWNLSFGNANGKQGWLPQYWYWPQLDDQQYSYFRRLFEDPDFAQRYVDRWAELRTNILASANIIKRIDELAALLQEAQARNFQKWPIMGLSVHPNYFVGDSYDEEVRWLKQWIQTRLAWIDNQFLAAPAVSARQNPKDGITISMSSPAGKIYYTLEGDDPRSPGGATSPKARLYDGPVPLKEADRIFARVRQDDRWSATTIFNSTKKQ
jgi:CotH kinase protein/Chitobiase/beta-hexosaminidase C-terminal domain/Fn3 associated